MNEPIPIKFKGKTYYGFEKCPNWLRKKYLEAVGNKCEKCPAKENLEIHRPKRGVESGLYNTFSKGHPMCNWQVLCKSCHAKLNYSRKCNPQ